MKDHINETIIITLVERIRCLERSADVSRKELVEARSNGSQHRMEAYSLKNELRQKNEEIEKLKKKNKNSK